MNTTIREFWAGLPRWWRLSPLIILSALLFWLLCGAFGLWSRTWVLGEFGPHGEALAMQVQTQASEMAGEVDPGAEVYFEAMLPLSGKVPPTAVQYRITTNSKKLHEAWVSRSPDGR